MRCAFGNVAESRGTAALSRNQFHDFRIRAPFGRLSRPIKHELFGPSSFFFLIVAFLRVTSLFAQTDITQPGDLIVGSSGNTPISDAVANAIDNQPTVYLNLDKVNTGFTVTPLVGSTMVTGLTLQAAGDAAERDPASYILSGSNDGSTFTELSRGAVPPFPSRNSIQKFTFTNDLSFTTYRLIFPTFANPAIANSMQIAEVELLGVISPRDVTNPSDLVVGSSENTPPSEGAANATDDQPTVYRNFDKLNAGFTVTPSIGKTIVVALSLTSASDAPERDPTSYVLFASKDGAVFTQIAAGEIPIFTGRSAMQEILFENSELYSAYKLIFPTVADASSADSMQIAEVEFLGYDEKSGAIPRFNLQPVDTKVLADASAHFKIALNGPWQIQWYRNGFAIAGATQLTYDTPPVDAGNNGDAYYAVARNGALATHSDTAHVQLFTPSGTQSIAINFRGGGANGAPSDLDATDIAGVWPQAYWNNAVGDSGALSGDTLLDSNNAPSPVFIDWQTPGSWGTGVGIDTPDLKMLNGYLDPQNGNAAIITFSNLEPGKYRIISYALNRPGALNDADYSVSGAATSVMRIRAQNADEFNAAPGFLLGADTDPNARPVANYLQFDDVSPAADGTVVFTAQSFSEPGEVPAGSAPVNGIQIVVNPPTAPVITRQPLSTNVIAGATGILKVVATGTGPLAYEWRKDGTIIFDGGHISGATTAVLTISNADVLDEGNYTVTITNIAGSAPSDAAAFSVYVPGRLTAMLSDATVTLTWSPPGFILQSSDIVNGTYTDVPGASGTSHIVNAATGNKFYRLFQP